jgi:hypothetical protein
MGKWRRGGGGVRLRSFPQEASGQISPFSLGCCFVEKIYCAHSEKCVALIDENPGALYCLLISGPLCIKSRRGEFKFMNWMFQHLEEAVKEGTITRHVNKGHITYKDPESKGRGKHRTLRSRPTLDSHSVEESAMVYAGTVHINRRLPPACTCNLLMWGIEMFRTGMLIRSDPYPDQLLLDPGLLFGKALNKLCFLECWRKSSLNVSVE